MACFFCPVNNARQCGGSCGLCGTRCPGFEPEPTGGGLPNGMCEQDYE